MSDLERRIGELLRQMTLAEKLALVAGVDMWRTAGVPRLGVPGLKLTDGPHGARGESFGGERILHRNASIAILKPCSVGERGVGASIADQR